METKKIKALEAMIVAMEISEEELTNWFNNRGKDKTGLIPTKLPLVYRRGFDLTVEDGLNLSRKEELWGIQLLSGVMVALKCGSGNDVSATSWEKVKKFAHMMRFNGEPGCLPSKDALIRHFEHSWVVSESLAFIETVNVLIKNGVEADGYVGHFWCLEEYAPGEAYYYFLDNARGDNYGWGYKEMRHKDDRIALIFNI